MELHAKKVVHVVASADIESRLVRIAEKYNHGGYTIYQARGGGATGLQSGMLDVDSNIVFMMVVDEQRSEPILVELDKMIKRGFQMIVYVTDAQVLRREKFGGPRAETASQA
jgi:hypothetical protein